MISLKRNILLKNHTTFRVGGKAKYFFEVRTREDLMEAVKLAKKIKLPFFILGGGSNLLVSDKGYKGLVINFQLSSLVLQKNKIIVGAGTRLAKLVNYGLEWAAGIPGTVGGAVYGNAGAFEKSMESAVASVEAFDLKDKKIKIFKNKDCSFSYRQSIFKRKKNLIILSVEIRAGKSDTKKIKKYLDYRRRHHPQLPSAGSVFKNFQLPSSTKSSEARDETKSQRASTSNFQELLKKYPEFVQFKKTRSIPAALLILKCDLTGKKIGQAQVSEKHSNFIVNLGNAKAVDVKKLIDLVKKTVKKKLKIGLEEEIQYLGFKN